MSRLPASYRERRKRRLRIVAAVVALCLIAQPLLVAYHALKDFGAGVTFLLLAAAVTAYIVYTRRRTRDSGRR